MQEQGQKKEVAVEKKPQDNGRRKFLKTAAAAGAAVAASSAVGPFIKTSSAAQVWKVQSTTLNLFPPSLLPLTTMRYSRRSRPAFCRA